MKPSSILRASGCLTALVCGVFLVLVVLGGAASFGYAVTHPGGGGLAPKKLYPPDWALTLMAVCIALVPIASFLLSLRSTLIGLTFALLANLGLLVALMAIPGRGWVVALMVAINGIVTVRCCVYGRWTNADEYGPTV